MTSNTYITKIILGVTILMFANASNCMIKEEDTAYRLQEKQEIQLKQVPTLFDLCLKVLKKNIHLYDLEALKSILDLQLPEKVLKSLSSSRLASSNALLLEGIFDGHPRGFSSWFGRPKIFENNDGSFSVTELDDDVYIFTDNVRQCSKKITPGINESATYLGMTSDYRYLLLSRPMGRDNDSSMVWWIDLEGHSGATAHYLMAGSHNKKGYLIFPDFICKGNDWNSQVPLDPKYPIILAKNTIWVPKNDDYFVGLLKDGKQFGVFNPNTGICEKVLKHNEPILCFTGDKNGDKFAALDKHSIKIWNPYTGEKINDIAHKLCLLFGLMTFKKIYSFQNLLQHVGVRERGYGEYYDVPSLIRLSFSENEIIFIVGEHGEVPRCSVAVPYRTMYMWDIESGKCVYQKGENRDFYDPQPIYKLLKQMPLKELIALITLEKQHKSKQEYQFNDWKLLQNSQFESIRELCKTRYILPEHRPDSDDRLGLLTCLDNNVMESHEKADEKNSYEDALCTIQ